jgi:DNA-binding transcriptional ArsR family regulator
VHRLPSSRADWRVIDGERVCGAIDALDLPGGLEPWGLLFATLGETGRLSLLLAIQAAGPISVSDLAAATGLRDTAVSQSLRLLRDRGLVQPERTGKVIRYALSSAALDDVLRVVRATQGNPR